MIEQVGIDAAARPNSNQPGITLGVVAGALNRLPGDFQKYTVLRVEQFRLPWIEAKKRRIELVCILDNPARIDERPSSALIRAHLQLLVRKARDGFHPRDEVIPKCPDAACTGKPAGHADDRNAIHIRRKLRDKKNVKNPGPKAAELPTGFCAFHWRFTSRLLAGQTQPAGGGPAPGHRLTSAALLCHNWPEKRRVCEW